MELVIKSGVLEKYIEESAVTEKSSQNLLLKTGRQCAGFRKNKVS